MQYAETLGYVVLIDEKNHDTYTSMVTQNMLRTHERKWVFGEKNILFLASLDLIKRYEQIK